MHQSGEKEQKKKYQKPLMEVILFKADGALLLEQSMDVIIEQASWRLQRNWKSPDLKSGHFLYAKKTAMAPIGFALLQDDSKRLMIKIPNH